MKSPTLADVASLAGVSKATASRAMSPSTRALVLPGTEHRVREAAERLGFVPSRVARGLARGSTGLLAAVVPTLDNSFFLPIIGGAQQRAAASDFQLTVAVHPMEGGSSLNRLVAQVDGMLMIAPKGSDEQIREVAAARPVVLVDREVDGISSVVADTASAFADLVTQLIDRGHTRIAYIGGPSASWQNRQRTARIRRVASSRAELTMLGPVEPTFASGVRAAEAIIAAGVSAVVPYSTGVALGVMFGLRAAGVRTPQDVLVSSEQVVANVLRTPDAPAIDVDGEALGTSAATRLLDLLADPQAAPTQDRLPVSLTWSS